LATDVCSGLADFDADCRWSGAGVLVTGASGFVGRRLTRHLAALGAAVTQLSSVSRGAENRPHSATAKAGRFVTASVTDLAKLAEIIETRRISTVFHLAAINANRGTAVSPYPLFEVNIRGTYTVLEACRTAATPPRAVVVSSREAEACFDRSRGHVVHPYAASKAAAELVSASFAETFGLKVATLRTSNIYGGGDLNWNRLIPSAIRSLIAGEAPRLSGSLHALLDYIHVDDVVDACLAAAEHSGHLSGEDRVLRISTGVRTSTLGILRRIAMELGRCDLVPQTVACAMQEGPDERSAQAHDAPAFGWASRIDLDQGLAKTVRWYQRFFRLTNRG